MFDIIQVILWGVTYIFIILFTYLNFKTKLRAIPLNASMLNFAWEINAIVVSNGFWAHILWGVLDVFIIFYNVYSLNIPKRVYYLIALIVSCVLLNNVFHLPSGMLVSVFAIDLYMAISFLIDRKKLLSKGKIIIAIFKLLGDLAAAIYYSPSSIIVFIIAVFVLVVNSIYLFYCVCSKYGKRI